MISFKQHIIEATRIIKGLPNILQSPDAVSFPEDKPEIEAQPEEPPVEKPVSKVITLGPSTTISAPKTKGPQPSPMYTVGSNESLEQIARKHGTTTHELMNLNKGIKNPSMVPQGTQIRTRK